MGRKKIEEKDETISENKKKTTIKKTTTKKRVNKNKKDETTTLKKVEEIVENEVEKEKIKEDNLNENIKDNDLNKDLEDTKLLVVKSEIYKVRIADIIAVIVSIILVLFLLYEVVLYDKVNIDNSNINGNNNEKLEASLNKKFRITTEDSIDISKFFQNGDLLSDSLNVIIINNKGERINLEKRYYDIDGTEVDSSVALSNGELNGGFYTKFYIGEVGTLDVTVKDLDNNKEYKTKFIVEDKTKPVLVLRDVVVNANEEVSVDSFVLSIYDNSKKDCKLEFVLKDGETLDVSEGERIVKIKATDVYGNEIVREARLIVIS